MTQEYLRYSCQIALPGYNEITQSRLQQAKVLIAGAGGLGCPAAQYLVASGVGTVGIADHDTISITNLHRQILYTHADIGLKKAQVATAKLQLQNPLVHIAEHDIQVNSENVLELIALYDIVVDCTDNFDTRYLLNDACVLLGKTLVYGAIYQYEGQLGVWNVVNSDGTRSPNYRDLYPHVDATQIPNCADGGVLPTLAGIIGCMQANEVIKYLAGVGEILSGKLLIIDVQTLQSHIINIGRATKTQIVELTRTILVKSISVNDLKDNLHSDKYCLIDIRTNEEREKYHIGGKHIPLHLLCLEKSYLVGKPVVLYCSTGKRSAEAVRMLLKETPDIEIYSLAGGLKAWQEANL
ncbi:MAG: HesA/MoeB/ThiF family protein [Bacteroidota bacterium]